MASNKIILKSFWDSLYTHPDYIHFKEYFTLLFEDVLNKYDEIHIYSIFGPPPNENEKDLYQNILFVQFSGESYYKACSLFDLSLIPAIESVDPLVVPLALAGQYLHIHNFWSILTQPRIYENDISIKNKFCSFVVSNGSAPERNKFFEILTQYKHVDSSGKFKNNTGYLPPDFDTLPYFQFISQYKFSICFENSHIDNYFTEKLVNAYMGKAIPIYWGCPQVPDFINLKAIIYIPEYTQEHVEKAFHRIIELDNDPIKYKEVYEQPLFIDNKIPDILDIKLIKNKITHALINSS